MLFNSYGFILLFLPITLLGYFWVGRFGLRAAIGWLVGASLFFYGWWNPIYLGLIVGLMLFNYWVGSALSRRPNKGVLAFGIAVDLAVLGYFKYANFFVTTVNQVGGTTYHLETILLPLGISFFTFQKIAYLVDSHKGETRGYSFLDYCLFVLFFPQLIAGPIVHHREMMPQFRRPDILQPDWHKIALGLTVFTIGLFKKVVIADTVAKYANLAFDAAAGGLALTFFEAWRGAIAYSAQLYFDFSGYSDMAIGLGLLFGIVLPINFNSPYRSRSIVEFWRRWHMTLSRFLRDYVYIGLGGNRKGPLRRYLNLFVTMLLGGLWHGAAWTFVFWGALHGFYLVVNHAWSAFREKLGWSREASSNWGKGLAWMVTFAAIIFGWVFFRAQTFDQALLICRGMLGLNGVVWPGTAQDLGAVGQLLASAGMGFDRLDYFQGANDIVVIGLVIAIFLKVPNTMQLVTSQHLSEHGEHAHAGRFTWRPSLAWASATGVIALVTLLHLTRVSAFLYFQF